MQVFVRGWCISRCFGPWIVFFFDFIISLFTFMVISISSFTFSYTMSFYLTTVFSLGFFFESLIFFILISCREWRVSRSNPSWLGVPQFFYDFVFIFYFYHFALNYWHWALLFFFLLFLFRYFKNGLIKLTRVILHFCSQCFFI